MTGMIVRRVEHLQEFDIEAALAAGLRRHGPARTKMFATAVLAAGLRAEELGLSAFQFRFLSARVRSLGLALVSALPEDMLGHALHRSVRAWLTVAHATTSGPGDARDELFAQWLDAIADVLFTHAQQAVTERLVVRRL
ncbi:hypothetical protein [Nocardia tengchongensis]|uniref:hypothetical protein n=1 Tax=Nocardia tengchongensis TaxID=2055889 RepID=UPI003607841D